jgi:acylphosphatase
LHGSLNYRYSSDYVQTGVMNKQVHVIYEGRVQGVGFRFTCQRIASNMQVAGWVKNMPEGTVEMAAEGDENTLNEFLDAIKTEMAGHISRQTINWSAFNNEFKGFNIR